MTWETWELKDPSGEEDAATIRSIQKKIPERKERRS